MSKHDAAYIEKFQPTGPEVTDHVHEEWLRFAAGDIWVSDTYEEAVDLLIDIVKGFGIKVVKGDVEDA